MAKEGQTFIMFNMRTQLTLKHILTKCFPYETQRNENNILDRLRESLGPQLDATDKIIKFLK